MDPIKKSLQEQIKDAREKGIGIIIIGPEAPQAHLLAAIHAAEQVPLIVNFSDLGEDDRKTVERTEMLRKRFENEPPIMITRTPDMYTPDIRVSDVNKPWYSELGKKHKRKKKTKHTQHKENFNHSIWYRIKHGW